MEPQCGQRRLEHCNRLDARHCAQWRSGHGSIRPLENTTGVSISANTEVNGIVFNSGASAFTITASPTFTLTISGIGITNNSGTAQNFVTAVDGAGNNGTIVFTNSATAGTLTVFTNEGGAVGFGGSRDVLRHLDRRQWHLYQQRRA